MSGTPSNLTQPVFPTLLPPRSTSTSNSSLCTASSRTYHYFEMSINSGALAVHLFLCLSILVYRRKLRQNIINLYAANLVFSNLVLIVTVTTTSYMEYFGYTRDPQDSIPEPFLYFWFTLKVCTFFMFLVICGGIGLLLVAMKKNMFRVHRTVAGLSRNSVQTLHARDIDAYKKRKSISYRLLYWIKRNPKTFAAVEIALVWFIPILISTASYYDNGSCVRICNCLMNFIPTSADVAACPEDSHCNELIPSMNNTTLVISFSIWMFCVIVLLLFFAKSYCNFLEVMHERKEALKAHSLESDPRKRVGSTDGVGDKSMDFSSANSSPQKQNTLSPNMNSQSRTLERNGVHLSWHNYPKSLLSESLKKNLLFLFLIAVIFIIGTGPFVITSFLSVFLDFAHIYHNGVVQIPLNCVPVLAATLNSIVLCGSHFGLNIAIKYMAHSIVHCRFLRKKKK